MRRRRHSASSTGTRANAPHLCRAAQLDRETDHHLHRAGLDRRSWISAAGHTSETSTLRGSAAVADCRRLSFEVAGKCQDMPNSAPACFALHLVAADCDPLPAGVFSCCGLRRFPIVSALVPAPLETAASMDTHRKRVNLGFPEFSESERQHKAAHRTISTPPLTLLLAKLEQFTMINADLKTTGSKLVITVDLSKEHGPSKSGKTIIIATSSGNQKIEGTDAIIGLNIYRKR